MTLDVTSPSFRIDTLQGVPVIATGAAQVINGVAPLIGNDGASLQQSGAMFRVSASGLRAPGS